MDETGDIPDRELIAPELGDSDKSGGSWQLQIVRELLDNGGVAHVYLPHRDDDYHLHQFNTHLFPDEDIIFLHADDTDMWIVGDAITMIERHYEA